MDSPTLCFTCGQPIADPPRPNCLQDGEPCPACRDRALDALPPIFPSQHGGVLEDEGAAEGGFQATLNFPPIDPDLGEPA